MSYLQIGNSNATGLQKVSLKKLEPDLNNALIVGIIIGKQRPRKFADAKSGQGNVFRAVWNFTLRDSPQDYINVTYWANSETIFAANEKFHIRDVVEIIRPKVSIRKINDYGEQFRPMVTSPYSLTLNENSEIIMHEGNASAFTNLLQFPTKPMAGSVPLINIQNRGESMESNVTVDVLGAVRSVGTPRTVKTKYNEEVQVREVLLFDHSSQGVKLTIWEPDLITRASSWQPCSTILFLTDLRVSYSTFNRSYGVTTSGRTIVTEDPLGHESDSLRKHAESTPLEAPSILEQIMISIPDASMIRNVMSIQQVHNKLNIIMQNDKLGEKHVTALLYVVITNFDLDGLSKITVSKCGECHTELKTPTCMYAGCAVARGAKTCDPQVRFDFRIMLSDHTGSLINCRITNEVAERMLKCTASQFVNMTDDEKCHLKWTYLMERCAVRIVAMVNIKRKMISVLSCTLADKTEVAQRLPIY